MLDVNDASARIGLDLTKLRGETVLAAPAIAGPSCFALFRNISPGYEPEIVLRKDFDGPY
jgi:hypothetical protein